LNRLFRFIDFQVNFQVNLVINLVFIHSLTKITISINNSGDSELRVNHNQTQIAVNYHFSFCFIHRLAPIFHLKNYRVDVR